MENNPFLESLSKFETSIQVLAENENKLLQFRDELVTELDKISPNSVLSEGLSSLSRKNELSKQSDVLKSTIQEKINNWAKAWDATSPMRKLSDTYSDRVILLVFGKVNAGKSSFSNCLAEQFSEKDVKRFYFDQGKIQYFDGKFKEGVVETTARIQGIELGKHLVLLDTPGLHSVTNKNGDLTRQFTDSADAILWLSPSTSPGQVQELEDLKGELQKKKPLLPIITRSDIFEEDIDKNNEIIQIFHNKSVENRKLQENDVYERTVEQLSKNIKIKTPISISVHAYKKGNRDKELSGFTRLNQCLGDILDEAKTYKANKASQQVVNYLDKDVLTPLKKDVIPQVNELKNASNKAIENLQLKKQKISSEVTLSVCAEIPALIERHRADQDKQIISKELNALVETGLNTVLQRELKEYSDKINSVSCSLTSEDLGDFESITVDIEQVKGGSAKAVSTSAGTAAGAAIGGAIGGPIVAILGGVVGGLLGSEAGDFFIETETITEEVGISTEQMISKTTESTHKLLPKLVEGTIEDIINSIKPMQYLADEVNKVIMDFENKVSQLKDKIHA